jgi:tetratricopeptide (TPR) repeat protein
MAIEAPSPFAGSNRTRALLAARIAAIALACAWIYSPAASGGWIWDDFQEVASNPALKATGGLADAWLGRAGPDYFPLKTTFQWVEWRLWGDATLGYHLASIALHLLSALLLWRILAKLGVRTAWLGGLVFAVHPLAVESVAWIAELKNTLSLPPLLLAIGAYLNYDRDRRTRDLLGASAWFVAAMLCKSSVVMLPLVILLLAWWRRGRVGWSDLKASAPFLGISLVLGLVTVWFQEHRAVVDQDLGIGGIRERCALAARALVFYAGKSALPVGLMPAYPRWDAAAPGAGCWLAWLAVAILVGWAWRRRGGWGRHALLGAGFFALNLVPVLGLVPMAYLRISWVADHFAYVSLAAAAGLAAAGMDRLLVAVKWPATAWCSAAAVLAALALESRGLAAAYTGDEAFWSFAAARNPEAWIAHDNLGMALYGRGDVDGAIAQYREALRINPGDDAVHVNLGNALARTGRPLEAEAEYREAVRIRPDDTDARTDLGNLALAAGRFADAVREYEAVLRLRPADREVLRACAEARYRGGNALGNAGRIAEAVAEYSEALRLWPEHLQARANLGLAYSEEGRTAEAVAELEKAVRAKPDAAEAQAYLGLALVRAGRPAEAVPHYEAALKRDPDSADLHYNLAVALRAAGRPDEARAQFEAAARLGAGH